jgi:hypothetical protein
VGEDVVFLQLQCLACTAADSGDEAARLFAFIGVGKLRTEPGFAAQFFLGMQKGKVKYKKGQADAPFHVGLLC